MIEKSILMAEDNEDHAYLIIHSFIKAGVAEKNIRWVKNGKEAMEYLSVNIIPDFLFLDIKMPVADGFDVLRFLKEKNINRRVFVLTTANSSEDIILSKELGAEDYITKPLEWNNFDVRLKSILQNTKG